MITSGRNLVFVASSVLILVECVDGFMGVSSGLALRTPVIGVNHKSSLVSREMQNPFGGLFGGDGKKKKSGKENDLDDAIEDWKEIGFDINEVLEAEAKAKKDAKKDDGKKK